MLTQPKTQPSRASQQSGVFRTPALLREIERTLCTGSDAELLALIESGALELQDEPADEGMEY
jgi:hypothetical protein